MTDQRAIDLSPSGIQRLLEICEKAYNRRWASDATDFYVAAWTAFPDALRALAKVTEERDAFSSDVQNITARLHDAHRKEIERDIAVEQLTASNNRLVRTEAALASAWKDGLTEASRERIAALEAALKPFAIAEFSVSVKQDTQIIGTGGLLYGDLRKARAVLSGGNGE